MQSLRWMAVSASSRTPERVRANGAGQDAQQRRNAGKQKMAIGLADASTVSRAVVQSAPISMSVIQKGRLPAQRIVYAKPDRWF